MFLFVVNSWKLCFFRMWYTYFNQILGENYAFLEQVMCRLMHFQSGWSYTALYKSSYSRGWQNMQDVFHNTGQQCGYLSVVCPYKCPYSLCRLSVFGCWAFSVAGPIVWTSGAPTVFIRQRKHFYSLSTRCIQCIRSSATMHCINLCLTLTLIIVFFFAGAPTAASSQLVYHRLDLLPTDSNCMHFKQLATFSETRSHWSVLWHRFGVF